MPDPKRSLKDRLLAKITKNNQKQPTKTNEDFFDDKKIQLELGTALQLAQETYARPVASSVLLTPEIEAARNNFVDTHREHYAAVSNSIFLKGNENTQLRTLTRAYQDAWAALLETDIRSDKWDDVANNVHTTFLTFKVTWEKVGTDQAKKVLKPLNPPFLPPIAKASPDNNQDVNVGTHNIRPS